MGQLTLRMYYSISDSEVAIYVEVAGRAEQSPQVEVTLQVEGRVEPQQPPQPRGLPDQPRPRRRPEVLAGVQDRKDVGAGEDGTLAGPGVGEEWQQVRFKFYCLYELYKTCTIRTQI